MYDSFFYDHVATIYRNTESVVNGAKKNSKSAIYTDIPCALWDMTKSGVNTTGYARQSDENTHRINIDGVYPNIQINDIVNIGGKEYIVNDFVTYKDTDLSDDNTSLIVKRR